MPQSIVRDVTKRCQSGKLQPWEQKLKDDRNLSCEELGEAVASIVENSRKAEKPEDEGLSRITRIVTFKQQIVEKRLAFGEVYSPDDLDTHGDFMSAAEIESMAHKFMLKELNKQIDVMHDNKVGRLSVVESFIEPPAPDWSGVRESLLGVGLKDEFAEQVIKEAVAAYQAVHPFEPESWVMGVKAHDEGIWQAIKSGELTGFSFEAMVRRVPAKVNVERSDRAEGRTGATEGHSHAFSVKLDANGGVTSGSTDQHGNHTHRIVEAARTQISEGHRHIFSLGRKISDRAA